jgi:Ca2+-binding RTX toxin-like protein
MPIYTGTTGQDVFFGDPEGFPSNDIMYGLGGSDVLTGLAGIDILYGGDGADSLRSGNADGAVDFLFGGAGDDNYWVREFNDFVTELPGEGRDVIELWYGFQGTYTLPANVESLALRDGDGGIGNTLDNEIIVIAGATRVSLLDGREGNDRIFGGNAGETLLGGSGNDLLYGENGNDTLNGGFGADTLNGGAGNDFFVFDINFVFNASLIGIDTIQDFTVGTDKIVLDKTTFFTLKSNPGIGFSDPSDFELVTTDVGAATSNAAIVYNSVSDQLIYNQNGSLPGFGLGGQFAILIRPPLTAGDFIVQA